MKKLVVLLLLFPSILYAQQKSCCSHSASENFAMLSKDKNFETAHLSPLPLEFTPEKGAMITFESTDGKTANAFEIKSDSATNNWIFVFHEWWGLNDYIKREAERISNEVPAANVLAIDLYDGQTTDKAEKAQEIMQGIDDKRARAIIQGAINRAGDKAKIATIGWCFGGTWSLQASIMAGNQAAACVIYYGYPETDTEKLKSLQCGVLGIYGTKDNWITPALVTAFEKNLKDLNKKVIIKNFDAVHAFANPSNPEYDKNASIQANQLAIAYLRSRLR